MATVYLGVPIVGGEVHLYDPYTEPTSTGVVAPTYAGNFTATVAENTTVVGTYPVTTTGGEAVVYSLASTTGDHTLFNIDSATGAVTFKVAPNFEAPSDQGANNVYNVNVVATNSAGSTTATLAITVNDVNDGAVVTIGPTLALSIAENTSGTIANIIPTSGTGPFTYALTGTGDHNRFVINSSGALSFATPPNFEAPADSNADNVYNFNVTVSNAMPSQATIAVTVTVTDVAEGNPVVMSASFVFNVNENSTAVGSAAVVSGTSPIYALSGPDASLFSINAAGVLTFNTAPDFEVPNDQGTNNVYNLTVTASNAFGPDASSAVTVTVVDVSEIIPVTMPATATFTISERTTAIGVAPVATAGTTPIAYSITGADASLVSIVGGNLVFNTAPDFEIPTDAGNNNVYNFNVVATNGGGANTASTAITVTVTDIADIAVQMPATASFNVNENTTAVGSVAVTAGTNPTYALSGPDAALFSINASGTLSFIAPPDFEAPGDVGTNNVYNVTVTASNAFGSSAATSVTVTVVDATESIPVSMSPTATYNVNENLLVIGSAPTAVAGSAPISYTITGADAGRVSLVGGNLVFNSAPDFENPVDVGADNVFSFNVVATNNGGANTASTAVTVNIVNVNESSAPTIAPTASFTVNENNTVIGTVTATSGTLPMTYSVSGADANRVSINSSTGAITFNVGPDFEAPSDAGANNVYNFNVTANNVTNTPAVCAVTVTVVNVFEDVTPATITFATQNNATLNTQYQAVTDITSVEEGTPITFSNCEISTNGGTSWVSTGTPAFVTGQTKARATVMSSGLDGGQAYVDVTVLGVTGRFTVNNTPAQGVTAPSFAAPFTFSVVENTTAVGTATATAGTTPIAYSLTGTDASLFSINSSGVIVFNTAPNFEAPSDQGNNNVYNFTVVGTNGGGQGSSPVTVAVTNVVEDTTPNALVVNNITNAGVNQVIETPVFTVSGIDVGATAQLNNIFDMEVSVNTGGGFTTWDDNDYNLTLGTTFKFRITTSNLNDTEVLGSFNYAGITYDWSVRTIAADTSITPIVFTPVTVAAGSTYTTTPVQIAGTTPGAQLPIVAGGNLYWSVNRGSGYEPFVNTNGSVVAGDYIRFRMDAPSTPSTSQQAQSVSSFVTIAGTTVSLVLNAALAVTTPRTVVLGTKTAQATDQEVFSDIAVVEDLSVGIQIQVTAVGGSIRFDTGSGFGNWIVDGTAQLSNTHRFQVKHNTDALPGRNVITTVTYGGKTALFTSSTGAIDDSLSPIMIINRDGVLESTQISSNEITISGVNVPQSIRVSGCSYTINDGSATTVPGEAVVGDRLVFKAQSSAASEGVVTATITIGKEVLKWRISTRQFSTKPTNIRLMPKIDQALDTPTILRKRLDGISAGITVTGTNVELTNDNGNTWVTTPVVMVEGSTYFRVTVPGSSNYSRRNTVNYTINGVTETVFAITRRDPSTPKPRIESAATRAAKKLS